MTSGTGHSSRLDLSPDDYPPESDGDNFEFGAIRPLQPPSVIHFGFPWVMQIPASLFVISSLNLENIDWAIKHLEDSRNKFWSYLRELNGPFDDLPPPFNQKLPPLADALCKIGLEDAISRKPFPSLIKGTELLDQPGHRRKMDIHSEWVHSLEKLREIPGYERALCPKIMPGVCTAADEGPVVVVAGDREQLYALILRRDEHHDDSFKPSILHLLDRSSESKGIMSKMVNANREILHRDGNSFYVGIVADESASRRTNRVLQDLLETLWKYVCEPIVKHLGLRKAQKNSQKSRLWWCLVGQMEAMPIHASGIYTPDHDSAKPSGSTPKLTDFVISSYIPSLNALIDARTNTRNRNLLSSPNKGILLVGKSDAQGMAYLPQVTYEIKAIQSIVPPKFLTTLIGPDASVGNVLENIPKSSIVHFACHGSAKRDPLESGLVLHDGELTLGRLVYTDLGSVSVVVLSACQTAAVDPYRNDQVANLAAGLMAAGVSGVVATLWSMQDQVGPSIAREFYGALYHELDSSTSISDIHNGIDPREVAGALHRAVENLKEKYESDFTAWVPFIHMGI